MKRIKKEPFTAPHATYPFITSPSTLALPTLTNKPLNPIKTNLSTKMQPDGGMFRETPHIGKQFSYFYEYNQ